MTALGLSYSLQVQRWGGGGGSSPGAAGGAPLWLQAVGLLLPSAGSGAETQWWGAQARLLCGTWESSQTRSGPLSPAPLADP